MNGTNHQEVNMKKEDISKDTNGINSLSDEFEFIQNTIIAGTESSYYDKLQGMREEDYFS